jgi:hypothetical protein
MLNQKLYSHIECAVPHKCSKDAHKKCIQCEIGYSFIACDPILLQCGHHVCKECTDKVNEASLTCRICSAELKRLGNDVQNSSSGFIIQMNLPLLGQQLRDKFQNALSIFESIILFKLFLSLFLILLIFNRLYNWN